MIELSIEEYYDLLMFAQIGADESGRSIDHLVKVVRNRNPRLKHQYDYQEKQKQKQYRADKSRARKLCDNNLHWLRSGENRYEKVRCLNVTDHIFVRVEFAEGNLRRYKVVHPRNVVRSEELTGKIVRSKDPFYITKGLYWEENGT